MICRDAAREPPSGGKGRGVVSRNRKSAEARVAAGGIVAALVLACVLVAPRSAQAQSLHLVGVANGSFGSRTSALSADGRIVVGTSLSLASSAGYRWTAAGGRADDGLSSEFPAWNAFYATSHDASTVVGYGANPGGPSRAMRFAGPGTYQELGTLQGDNSSQAFGVSADGSVVVGKSYLYLQNTEFASRAFRWTAQGGMQALTNQFSRANAVSTDGNTIAGEMRDATGINAFRWTPDGGFQVLPRLPGTDQEASAAAVSPDGNIVVGYSGEYGAVWQNGSVAALTSPIEFARSRALSLSADGSVIVGRIGLPTTGFAGVWTAQTGFIALSDYLASRGVTVPAGIKLEYCTAVSADGMTFAGYTSGAVSQGFVATIPAPASFLAVAAFAVSMRCRRRAAA